MNRAREKKGLKKINLLPLVRYTRMAHLAGMSFSAQICKSIALEYGGNFSLYFLPGKQIPSGRCCSFGCCGIKNIRANETFTDTFCNYKKELCN